MTERQVNDHFFRYWGKAGRQVDDSGNQGHLLVYHCLDVAAVGRTLLDRNPRLAARLAGGAGLPAAGFGPALLFFLALHDVGKFSRRFQSLRPDLAERLGLEPTARPYVRHDQMSLLFFNQVLVPHLADGALGGEPADPFDLGDVYAPFIEVAAGHHGAPVDPPERLGLSDCFLPDDLAAALVFVREAARLFLPDDACGWPPIEPYAERLRHYRRLSHLLAGFFVLCDWIGSQERFFGHLTRPMSVAGYWQDLALPRAGQAVSASGILLPPPARAAFAAYFPAIAKPSPLQAWADRIGPATGPQLLILEDLTGSGKTEAALTAAGRLLQAGRGEGLYLALPTMATADAMYGRLATTYRRLFVPDEEPPSLVLAHGSRHLNPDFRRSLGLEAPVPDAPVDEESAAYCAAWLADNKKKTFLAAVGVGTIDQALLAVLPSRHQALRLFGLSRQVLVVDEVHACDAYVLGLLEALLAFQASAGGSAVLLSATLARGQRERLVRAFAAGLDAAPEVDLRQTAYPLATRLTAVGVEETPLAARPGSERMLAVNLVHDPEALLEAIALAAQAGAAVAYVRNTVADALAAAEALAARLGPERVTLFHARFALCDRLAIERDILARFGKDSPPAGRRGRVVVATQVIEQSLDLDFDLLASDLAPVDLLIQRAGRCCRHPRDDRPAGYAAPRLLVLAPEPVDAAGADWFAAFLPGAARVYPAHGRLWLTARLLAARGVLKLPADARDVIEGVYGPEAGRDLPVALAEVDDQAQGARLSDEAMADYNALTLDLGYTRQGQAWRDDEEAPTRLGEQTVTLRLARLVAGRLLPWAEGAPPETTWSLSEVRVRKALAGDMPEDSDPRLAALVRQARETMPDKGRWACLLPLVPDPDRPGCWKSTANINDRGWISYSATCGLIASL
jgi:CRISPR-associated endonuclease/helicase Cas3